MVIAKRNNSKGVRSRSTWLTVVHLLRKTVSMQASSLIPSDCISKITIVASLIKSQCSNLSIKSLRLCMVLSLPSYRQTLKV